MPAGQLKSHAARSAPIFAALGDPTRLDLIARLCSNGPASISNLASGSEISRQAITKHLHVLTRVGLIRSAREGRERVYEFDSRQLKQAMEHLEMISREWDNALNRLKRFVEES